ncbi:MAG: DUF4249 domain-containing protein [Bacteroidales bacterium]|nr:DUF4249 domain-containing protein [Bacteroidales bacterium]
MKLRSKYSIIYITVCILALSSSCTENINMPLNSTYTRLVVDGSITTDTTKHKVRLTKSGDALYRNPIQVISDAIVTISDGSNEFILHENSANKGVYETDPTVYGVPGKTYTLHISHVDINDDGVFEEYSAQSYLKKESPIDSIKIVYDDRNPDSYGWVIDLYAKEIGGGRNFYLMKAYKNNVLLTDSTSEYNNKGDNTGFNGGYYYGFPVYTLLKSKVEERVQRGDTITLEMDGITEEYFNFISDYILEYYPKMPIFSGPSANISTNIEPKNKAVGFFAAYSIARCSKVY